jgi:hypothetical protein
MRPDLTPGPLRLPGLTTVALACRADVLAAFVRSLSATLMYLTKLGSKSYSQSGPGQIAGCRFGCAVRLPELTTFKLSKAFLASVVLAEDFRFTKIAPNCFRPSMVLPRCFAESAATVLAARNILSLFLAH